MRVAAFTAGAFAPGARFRVRQYIPKLAMTGIQIQEFPAFFGSYPPRCGVWRLPWAAATLVERTFATCRSYRADVSLLQREMISTFLTLEPLTKSPRLLDVDDAVWLRRGGRFARQLAERCETVVCGNSYLAESFGRWNRNVAILPTAVDTARFRPGTRRVRASQVICWSGTSGGLDYVRPIERALRTVLSRAPGRSLRIVSDRAPDLRGIPPELIEYIPWSANNEVDVLQNADVGIMPLDDSQWSLGKCSYKMLTCMACGLPVVVSPVGMNAEVLSRGDVGFGARTEDEWVDALEYLLSEKPRAVEMGAAGREVIERYYSLRVLAPVLDRILRRLA